MRDDAIVADWDGAGEPFRLRSSTPLFHVPGESRGYDELWRYAGGHASFQGWLRLVDERIVEQAGTGLFDLPDRRWCDE